MILAPWSWNLLSGGTWLDSATGYELGAGPSNLVNEDPLLRCIPRGWFIVVAGVNDRINFAGGSTCTIAPGTYRQPTEFALAIQAAMNAVSSDWLVLWLQASTGRYCFYLTRSAGAATLEILTGVDTGRSLLRELAGFRNEDRAVDPHTGDSVAIHGPRQDVGTCDLGVTTEIANGAFYAGLDASPNARVSVSLGTTTAANTVTYLDSERFTPDCGWISFSSPAAYRYVRGSITDRHRDDKGRVSLGNLWVGRALDTDSLTIPGRINWEVSSYLVSHDVKSIFTPMQDGGLNVSEIKPGSRVGIAFNASPGLPPSMYRALEPLILALGTSNLCFVCFDTTHPASSSYLCRLAVMPAVNWAAVESAQGRYSVALEFDVLAVR